jgi:dTDP-4-dehydrorhamnose reductase
MADPRGVGNVVRELGPDIIVNAAAYTNVDQAESEPEAAGAVNAQAPEIMAWEVKKLGALLVHYSTDYVFNGSGNIPWKEDDVPEPINMYGQTKLEGEEGIRQSGCRHLILRLSWVYAARGRNFLQTMLRLACERDSLRVVNDQFGAPTGAELIADVTTHVIRAVHKEPDLCGTYHLAPAGVTTWFDYARLVVQEAEKAGFGLYVRAEDIEPVPSREFPTPAPRPLNSRLNTSRLEQAFGLHMPPWEQEVRRVLGELSARAFHQTQ